MDSDTSNYSLFSQRLKNRMADMLLTQADLAAAAHITHSAVSNYLRGDRIPKASELHKLAAALGVSMDWLWGADMPPHHPERHHTENLYLRKELTRLGNQLTAMGEAVAKVSQHTITIDGHNQIAGGVGNTTINITNPDYPNS